MGTGKLGFQVILLYDNFATNEGTEEYSEWYTAAILKLSRQKAPLHNFSELSGTPVENYWVTFKFERVVEGNFEAKKVENCKSVWCQARAVTVKNLPCCSWISAPSALKSVPEKPRQSSSLRLILWYCLMLLTRTSWPHSLFPWPWDHRSTICAENRSSSPTSSCLSVMEQADQSVGVEVAGHGRRNQGLTGRGGQQESPEKQPQAPLG